MRQNVSKQKITLSGWNNRATAKPTSLMVVSKFSPVFVGITDNRRFLFAPLDTGAACVPHGAGSQSCRLYEYGHAGP
jgi:hypothetical protein